MVTFFILIAQSFPQDPCLQGDLSIGKGRGQRTLILLTIWTEPISPKY